MDDWIEVTEKVISLEEVVSRVKNDDSGCVVTYVGLIRGHSQGRRVLSVEYYDCAGNARHALCEIARAIRQRWSVENIAICHRIGKLSVGEVNLVVAVASAHRKEGFAACQYAIDRFKEKLPTKKTEVYDDRSSLVEESEEETMV